MKNKLTIEQKRQYLKTMTLTNNNLDYLDEMSNIEINFHYFIMKSNWNRLEKVINN